MVKLQGGILLTLIQLCVRLSNSAYLADFSNYSGTVLYESTTNEIEKPVFYVYTQDQALFIITRGSYSDADFSTDAKISETIQDFGVFHTGFFNAASYVYDQTKDYINSWNGPVYFLGHSYGASVSQILGVLTYHYNTSVDFYSFAYAPMPSMDLAADDRIVDRLYAFVNDDDIVPTLSVPNCYQKFHILYPTIHNIPTDVLVNSMNVIVSIMHLTSAIDTGMYSMIYNAIPEIVIAAKEYETGVPKYVRYPSGNVYQLKINEPKSLETARVNPEIALTTLSVTFNSLSDHDCDNYIAVVDQILE